MKVLRKENVLAHVGGCFHTLHYIRERIRLIMRYKATTREVQYFLRRLLAEGKVEAYDQEGVRHYRKK